MNAMISNSYNYIHPKTAQTPQIIDLGYVKSYDDTINELALSLQDDISDLTKNKIFIDFWNKRSEFYTNFFNNCVLSNPNHNFTPNLSANPTFSLKKLNEVAQSVKINYNDKNANFEYIDRENNFSIKISQNKEIEKSLNSTPVSSIKLNRERNENLEKSLYEFSETIKKYNGFVDFLKKEYSPEYQKFLTNEIIIKTEEINKLLSSLEYTKKVSLLQAYGPRIPVSRIAVYKFKDTKSPNKEQYAFSPHHEQEKRFFRMTKFDRLGEIKELYLIDKDNGVVKNYCTQKKYTHARVNSDPKDWSVMSKYDINKCTVCEDMSKYLELLNEFYDYINENKHKSVKAILSMKDYDNSISFNRVRCDFINKINNLFNEQETNTLEVEADNNHKYIATRSVNGDQRIIEIKDITGIYENIARIDANNSKIIQLRRNGENLTDKNNNTKFYIHSSESFENKVKIMKNFLINMVSKIQENNSNSEELETLKSCFPEAIKLRYSINEKKRFKIDKEFPNFVPSNGCPDAIKFKIPNKEYQIEIKYHSLGNKDFQRMTVTDKDNKIIGVFLIEKYRSLIHNYCNAGSLSYSALARVPRNLVYKTKEQISDSGFETYLSEYLNNLVKYKAHLERCATKLKND